ncbi:MAG: hypothetical protein ACLGI6_17435 [Gammaproteobacteria bacterium]
MGISNAKRRERHPRLSQAQTPFTAPKKALNEQRDNKAMLQESADFRRNVRASGKNFGRCRRLG